MNLLIGLPALALALQVTSVAFTIRLWRRTGRRGISLLILSILGLMVLRRVITLVRIAQGGALPLDPLAEASSAAISGLLLVAVLRLTGVVTQAQRTEDVLESFQIAVAGATDAIGMSTPEGRHYYQNESFTRLFGLSVTDVDGASGPPATVYADEAVGRHVFQTIMAGDSFVGDVVMLDRDRRRRDVHVRAYAIKNRERKVIGLVGVHTDITDRKQAENKLLQITKAIDASSNAIGISDASGRHFYQNRALSDLFEYGSAEELQAAGGGPAVVKDPAVAKDMFDTIVGGRTWSGELEMVTRSGRVFPAYEIADAIKDGQGQIVGLIGIITDISEQRLLEEERLKSQKLESIAALAGGIAHDFNNLLQGVIGNLSMAKTEVSRPLDCLASLEEAERALQQSVALTSQLLTFAKGVKPVKKPMRLDRIIEDASRFALSGSHATCGLHIAPDLWRADVDEGQIWQVVQNIVLNASQAMPLGGPVTVTARNAPAGDAALPIGLPAGDFVLVSVEDAGPGIPEAHLARVFDPYFTTKEKGSGLGLATSYSIVRSHGGTIVVRSVLGKGTSFTFYLPAVVETAPSDVAAPRPDVAAPRRGLRILVMDDEEAIRNISRRLLKALGHDAVLAPDGNGALQAYRDAAAAGAPFDAVILDLTVRGGMGGAETMKRLLAIDPAITGIASSGYSDDATMADHLASGFRAFLRKPYDLAQLRGTLQSILPQ
jgi:two-component system, cell cycle sensor histidine kinase and response regulator CckA